MDIASHGLWGGIAFGRTSKKSWWTAFAFGIGPDLFSFGILFVANLLGLSFVPSPPAGGWSAGPPDPGLIPSYIHVLYNLTHSFVTFAIIFALVWLILKRPLMEMGAWAFHIVLDIGTHDIKFFPTPYLWPLPYPEVDGVSWGNPLIWYSNLTLLALAYIVWFLSRRKKHSPNPPDAKELR
ncbi:MAG: hypothetical protein AAB601_02805 [Patescibacteria group bacterium]